MRIVAALGGNALLERGEPPESAIQEGHIIKAVRALESAHDPAISRPYPFDVLGAQTQGMIGYWLVQALQNAVPGRQVACLVSRTLVSASRPGGAGVGTAPPGRRSRETRVSQQAVRMRGRRRPDRARGSGRRAGPSRGLAARCAWRACR